MACPETRMGNKWRVNFKSRSLLLTKELMDTMAENDGARFVSLSSSAHSLTGILWMISTFKVIHMTSGWRMVNLKHHH